MGVCEPPEGQMSARSRTRLMTTHLAGQTLDLTAEVLAPEHVSFQFRLAGPFQRAAAYLCDLLIRVGCVWGLEVLLGVFGWLASPGLSMAVFFLGWFFLEWFSGALFEIYLQGRTPGKWMFRLRVISVDGTTIKGSQALLRNLVRAADLLPLYGVIQLDSQFWLYVPLATVGFLVMLSNHRFQRLGDLVSGTMVVYEERQRMPSLPDRHIGSLEQYMHLVPEGFVPSHTMVRALTAYIMKRRELTPPRRHEMAGHLAKVLMRHWSLSETLDPDALLCAVYARWQQHVRVKR